MSCDPLAYARPRHSTLTSTFRFVDSVPQLLRLDVGRSRIGVEAMLIAIAQHMQNKRMEDWPAA